MLHSISLAIITLTLLSCQPPPAEFIPPVAERRVIDLASRIERLTSEYDVSLLISEYTLQALENPQRYYTRLIDRVQVKGKSESVAIYEVRTQPERRIVSGCLVLTRQSSSKSTINCSV